MKFYMVYSYTWDGEHAYTDATYPASTKEKAMDYLRSRMAEDEGFYWNTAEELKKNLPGQYDYQLLFFDELAMDEEI